MAVKRVVVMAMKNYCGDSNHVKNQDGNVVLEDLQILKDIKKKERRRKRKEEKKMKKEGQEKK